MEIKLAFSILVEDTFASGAAATYVHPVPRHEDHRTRTKIFGRCDLPAFFGPFQTWMMADSGPVVEKDFLNSNGVRLSRLE